MSVKRSAITAAAVTAGIMSLALPAGAATAASAAAVAKAAAKPIAVSTSWPTARSGIALTYSKIGTGGRPTLLETTNAGATWRKLPAPPITYPADNDIPDATWGSGIITVTSGTRIVASRDAGKHWSAVRLAGLPKARSLFVGPVTIADGRLFALVNTITASGTSTEAVYSGSARADTMRAVAGLSISGSLAYGDLTAAGGAIQVSLGANFARAVYRVSRNGTHFLAAPLPCPASRHTLLGGVRDGKPVALCSTEASSVGPGTNSHRVWIGARLGGQFKPAGKVLTSSNEQGFAAASDKDMVMSTTFPLYVTSNAGQSWTPKLPQQNGATWSDLAFQSSTTGVADTLTVNNSLKFVGTVYRTTNGGRTWRALVLP